MTNLKIKQLLKKMGMLLPFHIVCSLFICEKALAVWDKKDCIVACHYDPETHMPLRDIIFIYFKFFEYEIPSSIDNSYLESFEAFYSTNGGNDYKHLMSASTVNQTAKT